MYAAHDWLSAISIANGRARTTALAMLGYVAGMATTFLVLGSKS